MAIKVSKALRNYALWKGSWKNALQGGVILVYSGSAPTNAEDAISGTLLGTFSDTAGAYTAETKSSGTVTLTGGASGSVNTVTVGGVNLIANVGAVAFNTSLSQTASDLAAAINRDQSFPRYFASASGAVVTITPINGAGTAPNTNVVATTTTTITTTTANMAGGIASANGLRLSSAAGGIVAKDPFQIWRTVPVANGTAGYFRFVGPQVDAGAADVSETFNRLQGDVGTSGAALNLQSLTFAIGTPLDVNTFTLTEPAS